MQGLIAKDFLVFKMRFDWRYRLGSILLLSLVILLYPGRSASYVLLMLPMMGVAFLTEIVKVDEKSDWKDYLPVLPVTAREIILSRYIFCGLLLAAFGLLSMILGLTALAIGAIALGSLMENYVLGLWFAVLELCFGIPGGYYFRNESCTGAMIGACLLVGILRSAGADAEFYALASPIMYTVFLVGTSLLVYASWRVSLWIYLSKLCGSPRQGH